MPTLPLVWTWNNNQLMQYMYSVWISDALLPKEASHYIVPDCRMAKDYLELFELSDIQGVVFTQTAAHCVSCRLVHTLCSWILSSAHPWGEVAGKFGLLVFPDSALSVNLYIYINAAEASWRQNDTNDLFSLIFSCVVSMSALKYLLQTH